MSRGPAGHCARNLAKVRRNYLSLERLEDRVLLTAIVVNSLDDTNDGACNIIHCSLREAITAANATTVADTIQFAIPGSSIPKVSPASPLPIITQPVTIDGTTQSAGRVEIDGTNAGSGLDAFGLNITAGGSTVRGMVINHFDQAGIRLSSLGSNVIQGNRIGTDATGTSSAANGIGIQIEEDSPNNRIGGTTAAARNVISGNTYQGIRIYSGSNVIEGNYIGTDLTGRIGLGVTLVGVQVRSWINNLGNDNVIGGTAVGQGNVISGNSVNGVEILLGALRTIVQGNFIGTDPTGTLDVGNGLIGIKIAFASNSTVGGTTAAARNIISGNGGDGMNLSLDNTSGNVIQGNFIGTDVTGKIALGNTMSGLSIAQASGNFIGGTTPGAGNIISNNGWFGIWLQLQAASNLIQGNFIGTDVTGANSMGNISSGINIEGASQNTIGGLEPGAGNMIAFNGNGIVPFNRNGITLDASSTRDSFLCNSIVSNNKLGIDEEDDGVTLNDSGDSDSGGNDRQNFPVLTSAVRSAGVTTVQGSLNSAASTTYRLEFFVSSIADSSGSGEGQMYFGSKDVTTDATGNVSFAIPIALAAPSGWVVSATATDPAGNTSEFSNTVTVAVSGDGTTVDRQTAPALNPFVFAGTQTMMQGTLTSDPNTTYRIQFYSTAGTQPPSFGQTPPLLGVGNVTTDDTGVGIINIPLPSVPMNGYVTATASAPGCNTSEFGVPISRVNAPPDASDDSTNLPEDNGPTTIDVRSNDSTGPDIGEKITVVSVTQGAHGSVTIPIGGTSVLYTPQPNFNGSDSFTYSIRDDLGATDTATVLVTVTPVNDPPTPHNDSTTVFEDSGNNSIDVRANDTVAPDTNEILTVTAVTQPAHGSAFISNNGSGVTYAPNADFSGIDSFSYTVGDGNGGFTTATVTVQVTNLNDPPTAAGDSFNGSEDSSTVTISVLANDSSSPDPGEQLTVSEVTQPANGTVSISATGAAVLYKPAPNFNGSDSFTYTMSDGNGGTASATVTLNIFAVNDPPDAVIDSLSVAEDSSSNVLNVLANDTSPDEGETLSITSVTHPVHGTTTISAGGTRITYVPTANYFGSDSFTYRVNDGHGLTDSTTVNITVTPVNDSPTAVLDIATVLEDSTDNPITLLINDIIAPDTATL